MKHFTSLLVYNKDIPKSYIKIIKEELKNFIEINVASNKEDFSKKILDNNLIIVNSKYESYIDDKSLKLIIVTDNNNQIKNKLYSVIFDPFRNEDRSIADFDAESKVFLKTVFYALDYFKIPLNPDDQYHTILELD